MKLHAALALIGALTLNAPVIALAAKAPSNAPAGTSIQIEPLSKETRSEGQVAGACGWYVIISCSRSYKAAKRSSWGAPVLNTNNYPRFRNGFYCGYVGPFGSRSAAAQRRLGWLEAAPSAYVKRAC